MLVELSVAEQRYHAAMEVLTDGAPTVELPMARRSRVRRWQNGSLSTGTGRESVLGHPRQTHWRLSGLRARWTSPA